MKKWKFTEIEYFKLLLYKTLPKFTVRNWPLPVFLRLHIFL